MGDAGFFRGTSADQDVRFSNKEKKLLEQLKSKFPPEFETAVDLNKVNLDVVKPWITDRVTELLGIEDEVVIDYIFNMLEKDKKPDPRLMQINLTGFLESKTKVFMKELWCLFISAQKNPTGIPVEFLDRKKEELRKKKEEEKRISSGLSKKTEVLDEVKRKMLHSQVMVNAQMHIAQHVASQGRPGSLPGVNSNPLMAALQEHQKRGTDYGSGRESDDDRDRGRGRDRDRRRRRSRSRSRDRSRSRSRSRSPRRSPSPRRRDESPTRRGRSRSRSRSRSPSRKHRSRRQKSRSRSRSRSRSPKRSRSRRHRSRSRSRSRDRDTKGERRGSSKNVNSSGDEKMSKDKSAPSRWDNDDSPSRDMDQG
eukprot:comp23439_c0_seq1/m.39081 comp23439_c0_seq1/g.39081  ORF comp23439_c0_seq1/g.39081 comp23439_c0_seq1/m.39081 type:complete len:366 (-) comp23439_c0_seq1:537-1634(-)